MRRWNGRELRKRRCRHDFRRSSAGSGDIPEICSSQRGTNAGQYHRIRPDSAFHCDQLAGAGVSLALYPLSAFRAMSAAALNVYNAIRNEGSQPSVLTEMQTRSDLYDMLEYYTYEEKLDQLFRREQK